MPIDRWVHLAVTYQQTQGRVIDIFGFFSAWSIGQFSFLMFCYRLIVLGLGFPKEILKGLKSVPDHSPKNGIQRDFVVFFKYQSNVFFTHLGTLTYYMNGLPQGTTSGLTVTPGTFDLVALGTLASIDDAFCNCHLDEVKMYSRVLSQVEIEQEFARLVLFVRLL